MSTRPTKPDTYCFPIPTSRQSAHQAANNNQLSSHDDFQLVISMIRRIHVMCGESRTRVIVSGEGTELTNPARSMVSWFEGLFVDADGWSGIVWDAVVRIGCVWTVGMTLWDKTRHDRGAERVNACDSPATMTVDGSSKRHRKQLLILTLVSQVLILLLLFLCSYLPLFDSSPWTLLDKSTASWATSSILRWDVFHLRLVAEERMYEHQWAFFPGVPNFARLLGQIAPSDDWVTLLQGGVLVAIACDSTLVLYDLSLHHLKSSSLSFLSAILSLLPSSPATLRSALYAEPFFTWASYRGKFPSQLPFYPNLTSSRYVGMHKRTVGFSLGIFLSRRGLPFERRFTLWIHPLGVAR